MMATTPSTLIATWIVFNRYPPFVRMSFILSLYRTLKGDVWFHSVRGYFKGHTDTGAVLCPVHWRRLARMIALAGHTWRNVGFHTVWWVNAEGGYDAPPS